MIEVDRLRRNDHAVKDDRQGLPCIESRRRFWHGNGAKLPEIVRSRLALTRIQIPARTRLLLAVRSPPGPPARPTGNQRVPGSKPCRRTITVCPAVTVTLTVRRRAARVNTWQIGGRSGASGPWSTE